MPVKKFKSRDYLEFVAERPCVITGAYSNVDLHHESVLHSYGGALKKYFDFGALPLRHDVHLDERHGWGKHAFWSHYNLNPTLLVMNLIKEYVTLDRADKALAEAALERIERDQT